LRAKASTKSDIGDEPSKRRDPIRICRAQESVLTVADDTSVHSNRGGDNRSATRHVLDQFQAALATRPWVVSQRHDSDVEIVQIIDLSRFAPSLDLGTRARKLNIAGTDESEQAVARRRDDIGSGVDRDGNVYGSVVRRMMLEKHTPQR
jgi:hypothetical protein